MNERSDLTSPFEDPLPSDKLEGGLRAFFGEPGAGSGLEGPLAVLERRVGRPSRIHLGPEESAHCTPPVQKPVNDALRRLARGHGRGDYQVLGEVARGGMGVVLHGYDADLGRDVALKVLHDHLLGRGDVVQRFVEEAQIGGQLQHPGVVPVYEFGLMEDERPYFAMKLVKGRTLAALLAEGVEPRRELLSIFMQVCLTMAYAHTRHVIHRDLKPANVMVAAFGEVQVVDWGLAKVLRQGGVEDEQRARKRDVSIIETLRTEPGSAGSHSRAGSVLGTPAYMSPEQARGEISSLDQRTDVFSLGAVLCEILTGGPPYRGKSASTLREAAEACQADALARLEECDADAELVDLARHCLAPGRNARPRSAVVLAKELEAYFGKMEERAQEARIDVARANAREKVERKAYRRTAILAGVVVTILAAAGAGFLWLANERAIRRTELSGRVGEALAEATLLGGGGNLEGAIAAAMKAEALLASGEASPVYAERVQSALSELEAAQAEAREMAERELRNQRLLERLERVRGLERLDKFAVDHDSGDSAGIPPERLSGAWNARSTAYERILAEHGLEFAKLDTNEAAELLASTGIRLELALVLDDWARVWREMDGWDSAQGKRLLTIARRLDPDPWRDRLRLSILERREPELHALAEDASALEEGALALTMLAGALAELGDLDAATDLLLNGVQAYPDDYLVNESLGLSLGDERIGRYQEALGYFQAALALRPRSVLPHLSVAWSLHQLRRSAEAGVLFERAAELDPDSSFWLRERLRTREDTGGSEAAGD